MVIYMDQYSAARKAPAAWGKKTNHVREMVVVSRDPALMRLAPGALVAAPSPELPHDFAGEDVGAFLDKVRALATLI